MPEGSVVMAELVLVKASSVVEARVVIAPEVSMVVAEDSVVRESTVVSDILTGRLSCVDSVAVIEGCMTVAEESTVMREDSTVVAEPASVEVSSAAVMDVVVAPDDPMVVVDVSIFEESVVEESMTV
jgi:hypothetical protein